MKSNLRKELESFAANLNSEANQQKPPTSIYDVMARLSPHLQPPVHFDPYVRALDKAILEGGVDLAFHGPPQHGKTEIAKHAYIFAAMVRPGIKHAYSSFSSDRSALIMGEVATLAKLAGLNPKTRDGKLFLDGGTVIMFGGCGTGQLTGWPLRKGSIHIIDDPLKDRQEAVSPTIRERRWAWLIDVGESRRHAGSSTILMMARWDVDDLTARACDRLGWPYIRIPAICDSEDDPIGRQIGEALCPHLHTIEVLLERKARFGVITFESLWQGRPRAIGDALFGPPTYYDALPKSGPYTTGYGVDLAYTAKTRADYSVLLRGRWYHWEQKLYLTGRWKKQCQADVFNAIMKTHWMLEPGAMVWMGAPAEAGTAQLIQQKIPSFQFIRAQALGDKYVRALPTAEGLWNEPNCSVLVPRVAPWTQDFLRVVESFTGVGDPEDDDVDALAALGHLFLKGQRSGGNMSEFNRGLAARYGKSVRR